MLFVVVVVRGRCLSLLIVDVCDLPLVVGVCSWCSLFCLGGVAR